MHKTKQNLITFTFLIKVKKHNFIQQNFTRRLLKVTKLQEAKIEIEIGIPANSK